MLNSIEKAARQNSWRFVLLMVIFNGIGYKVRAQSFPDSVKEFIPGANAGFGSDYFPANVLGAPHGTANPAMPNFSPADILSLGTGGAITLEFTTNRIIDLPGPDFTIFENPVQPSGHPEQSFTDTATVSVSDNGTSWTTFPFDMISSDPVQLKLKDNYTGLAGVEPSFSSPDNGISPFDPQDSGGDQFDLATVGLTAIRFVRIRDTGDARYMPTYDVHGDIVYDYGTLTDPDPTLTGGISSGFDLDAVAAIHSEPYNPSSISDWQIYE